MILNYSKWDPITTPNYWEYLAQKSGIDPMPELLRYMKWRETPESIRQPKTQAELSKQIGFSEKMLEGWFTFLFQRAIDESLWETEEVVSPYVRKYY